MRPFGLEAPRIKHKYNVAPPEQRTVDGIVFASKAEARRYGELKIMVKLGLAKELELQPQFTFFIGDKKMFKYIADFKYFNAIGQEVFEDVKGVRTAVYRLKKKIIEHQYGIEITEIA